jgi:hypothetical protein
VNHNRPAPAMQHARSTLDDAVHSWTLQALVVYTARCKLPIDVSVGELSYDCNWPWLNFGGACSSWYFEGTQFVHAGLFRSLLTIPSPSRS